MSPRRGPEPGLLQGAGLAQPLGQLLDLPVAGAVLGEHRRRHARDVPGVVLAAALLVGPVAGLDPVAQLGEFGREPQVEAVREVLAQLHDGPPLDRLPLPLDRIKRDRRHDDVDVSVGPGHAVLLGRPRLGVLEGVPDHVAGDPILHPAALAAPRRHQPLDVRGRLPQRRPDSLVAALDGFRHALGHAGGHVPAGHAILDQPRRQALAGQRMKALKQSLELLEVGLVKQAEHLGALAAHFAEQSGAVEVVAPDGLAVVAAGRPGVLDFGETQHALPGQVRPILRGILREGKCECGYTQMP